MSKGHTQKSRVYYQQPEFFRAETRYNDFQQSHQSLEKHHIDLSSNKVQLARAKSDILSQSADFMLTSTLSFSIASLVADLAFLDFLTVFRIRLIVEAKRVANTRRLTAVLCLA